MQRSPKLWVFFERNQRKRQGELNPQAAEAVAQSKKSLAVILGYGPVGRSVDSILRATGLETVIVDLNMDTIQSLTRDRRPAIYGDAYNIEVMHQALAGATHLVITLQPSSNRNPLIASAKLINPVIKVFVRAHYIGEREDLMQVGADSVCYEELEASVALARLVLFDRGADAETIRRETTRIRAELW
jgi:CPA2 family monovalent cation:H+ antiporter-2